MTRYNQETEAQMKLFFLGLSEKDQRHYVASEAMKLGWGGKSYISELLEVSHYRIRMGEKELTTPDLYAQIPLGKQRRLGGGRKTKELSEPEMVGLLTELIDSNKAGSPTDPTVYWIHLKPREIAARFLKHTGHKVSNSFVKRILKTLGYGFRKLSKNLAIGPSPHREKQFQVIFDLVTAVSTDTPILSIDCKKKERLGNLYREGKCYSTAPINVFDHDYFYLSKGKIIPHGIYDMTRNEGYMTIGNSHETAEFIKDNLLWWWDTYGIHHYPTAKCILIFCDAGGANSYRHHAFKKQMLQFAQAIGIDIIICHYPPYTSKWNPIEHRLFCHVHKTMQGVVLSDYNLVKELISKTTTKTGLKVFVRLHLKKYAIGIKTDEKEVDYSRIQFNKFVPELSYRIAA